MSLGDFTNKLTGWLGLERGSDVRDIDEGAFQLQGQDQRRKQLLQQADFAAGRGGPAGSRFASQQGSLINTLQRQASGQGPSMAQMQLNNAMGKSLSQQQALMATGGPGNARMAMQQASAQSGSLAGQAAMARLQEQRQAQGMLAQTLGQARSQDQRFQQLGLQSRQMNDVQQRGLMGMELQNAQAGMQGRIGLEQALLNKRQQDLSQPTGTEKLFAMGASVLGSMKKAKTGGMG